MLVTGAAGLLGSWLLRTAPAGLALHATYRRRPVEAVPATRVDLADAGATARLVAEAAPDVVVHAAYAKQDGERDIVAASRNVAAAAAAADAALVHVSSDVVFGGERAPYAEGDPPEPVDAYGRFKAAAEREVAAAHPGAAIVRTSLILSTDPPDHVQRELAAALKAGREPTLYHDELRCPVPASDLARALWEIAGLRDRERAGVWHIAGPEAVSRYTLGCLVAARLGLPAAFRAVPNATHPSPRPRDLRLLTTRADATLRLGPRPAGAFLAAR